MKPIILADKVELRFFADGKVDMIKCYISSVIPERETLLILNEELYRVKHLYWKEPEKDGDMLQVNVWLY